MSKQDFDNAVQTNLANQAQVKAANAAIGAAKAQIQASQAAVETTTINLNFTRIVSPIDGIVGIAQAQVSNARFATREVCKKTTSRLPNAKDSGALPVRAGRRSLEMLPAIRPDNGSSWREVPDLPRSL
jgi:hypothetical protein